MATDSAKPARKPLKVLVVDDMAMVRELLVEFVRTSGDFIVVGEAGDGAEAVALVEQSQPDIVLMDIAMPRMNGIAATSVIRRRFPSVQVVVVSAYDDTEAIESARRAGAVAFITKSKLSVPRFLEVLRQAGRPEPVLIA